MMNNVGINDSNFHFVIVKVSFTDRVERILSTIYASPINTVGNQL